MRIRVTAIPLLRASLASLVLAGACASSGTTRADDPGSITTRTTTPIINGAGGSTGFGTGLTSTSAATTSKVQHSADVTFSVLQGVYDELKIPVTTLVTKDRLIGNPAFKQRRAIGPLPMRGLFDCGGPFGDPNAETYELTITLTTEVRDDGPNASVIASLVEASARPVAFAGNDVRCTSTGQLEARIAALAESKLAQIR